MSGKHEVDYFSDAKIIKVILSCHGNKASKTASTTRYVVPQGAYVPNIRLMPISS